MTFDGRSESLSDSVCLFERHDLQPPALARICGKYKHFDSLDYRQCEVFLREVEVLGYTFEYGLDGVPFDLRPIEVGQGQFRHAEICEESHKTIY